MKTAIQHLKTAIQHLKISSAGFHNFAFYLLTFYFPNQINQFEPIMQNKPNFWKSQMNVNIYNTTDYENKSNWTIGESKPNSNPIKPNFKGKKILRSLSREFLREKTGKEGH